MISRRSFLEGAGAVAGSAAVGGAVWAAVVRDSVNNHAAQLTFGLPTTTSTTTTTTGAPVAAATDRVLVLLELAGGNDALNTLVPIAGSPNGAYHDLRPTLALDDAETIELASTDCALHAALAPIAPLWDESKMAIAAGVGIAGQSRSHFKAMDAWWAGSGAPTQTGWLGRWLDASLDAERNGVDDPLRAIALGGGARALAASNSTATVVRNPSSFQLRTAGQNDADAIIDAFLATSSPLASNPTLASAQQAIPITVDAVNVMSSVIASPDAAVSEEGNQAGSSEVSTLLQAAAGIVELGIGTRVITVGINGFDTHADQLARHSVLWSEVAEGLAGFFARLEASGNRDRVTVLTTSEFGRRAAENGSGGTDHGGGGLQFLFGSDLQSQQIRGALDLSSLRNGDLPVVLETPSVYAAALHWLGDPAHVSASVGEDVETLPFFSRP